MPKFSELKLEQMSNSDLASVIWIEKASFSSPWSREDFENELYNENVHFLVLKDDNKVIAYVVFTQISNRAHIANLAVHPYYRRKGVGYQLLSKTLNFIKSQGVQKVTLEVRIGNIAAQNLYSKLGFKVVGFRKNYYIDNNESALVMRIDNLEDYKIA